MLYLSKPFGQVQFGRDVQVVFLHDDFQVALQTLASSNSPFRSLDLKEDKGTYTADDWRLSSVRHVWAMLPVHVGYQDGNLLSLEDKHLVAFPGFHAVRLLPDIYVVGDRAAVHIGDLASVSWYADVAHFTDEQIKEMIFNMKEIVL